MSVIKELEEILNKEGVEMEKKIELTAEEESFYSVEREFPEGGEEYLGDSFAGLFLLGRVFTEMGIGEKLNFEFVPAWSWFENGVETIKLFQRSKNWNESNHPTLNEYYLVIDRNKGTITLEWKY